MQHTDTTFKDPEKQERRSFIKKFFGVLGGVTLFSGLEKALAQKKDPPVIQTSNPFLGSIVMFAGNFAPRGWAFCDGQLLSIASYSALFSLLGTNYGGDGRTTFGLPDLRGRVPIHDGSGSGPGLSSYSLGQKGGTETSTLSITQIPSHTHSAVGTVQAHTGRPNSDTPAGHVLSSSAELIYSSQVPDTVMSANNVNVTVGNTGGSQSHDNRQPFQAINFIIALQGTFPSRS